MSNKIKELRLKRGLSQEDLAKKVGVSRVAVVFWEQGKAMPHASRIKAVAKALRCKVTDLL
jgi:transcriptional regulator with XRE-family HTH domain